MASADLLIINALIDDGTGEGATRGSLAIDGDRIAAVGDLAGAPEAGLTIDAAGALVCPGFIDIHTHSDLSSARHPGCASKVRQGVTTDVVGNCSFSAFPVSIDHADDHADLLRMIDPADKELSWRDLDGYAASVERAAPAINIVPLVGHGTLRIAAGIGSRPAIDAGDRARLGRLLQECFDQGAFGFSTGLSYMPSGVASREEITDLVRLATECGRLYATHTRAVSEADAFAEAAETARATNARLQFSHLAINQPSLWGRADTVLEWFHRLRADTDVGFDVYPYDASSSALTQHLPLWVQQGGVESMRGRLADRELRARVLRELQSDWWGEGPWRWERFVICAAPAAQELLGRSIAELADDFSVAGEEMAVRLCETFGNAVHIVLHYREESDVIAFMRDDLAVIGSDGLALPGGASASRPHPRSFGSFPRVLGRFVRELRVMNLAQAIRKMTSAPADRLKLRRRGRLAPGYFADVVIIDTTRVADRATYLQPIALAEGIETVIVNGKPVLRGGQETGSRAGRLLRYNAD